MRAPIRGSPGLVPGSGSGLVLGGEERGELRAPVDPQLPEHLVQVVLDRPRAEEQRGGGVAVARARGHEPRHLTLLRRQPLERATAVARRARPGRAELVARPLGPRVRAGALEVLERGAEGTAGLRLAARPAQALAEEERRARAVERAPVAVVQAHRLG